MRNTATEPVALLTTGSVAEAYDISPYQPTSNSVLPATAYPRKPSCSAKSRSSHDTRRRHNLGVKGYDYKDLLEHSCCVFATVSWSWTSVICWLLWASYYLPCEAITGFPALVGSFQGDACQSITTTFKAHLHTQKRYTRDATFLVVDIQHEIILSANGSIGLTPYPIAELTTPIPSRIPPFYGPPYLRN